MKRAIGTVTRLVLVLLAAAPAFAQTEEVGPSPGRLVQIEGRRLHLHCMGQGGPTVILEAGASAFALDWALVQPEVAKVRRVCAYDRAGSGWSDARSNVETPARVVADLHALLLAAGEKPPFLLVGASMGGVYARLYLLDHPADVVGLVLVDPASEDRLFAMFEGRPVRFGALTAAQLATTLPSGPVPIPRRDPQTGEPFDRLPPHVYELRLKLDRRLVASFPPDVSAEVVRESSEGRRAALARLLASRDRPDSPLRQRPLIVLSRGRNASADLAESHASLARLSDNARHVVVADSGHEVHLFTPSVVVQAIDDVARAVVSGARLAP